MITPSLCDPLLNLSLISRLLCFGILNSLWSGLKVRIIPGQYNDRRVHPVFPRYSNKHSFCFIISLSEHFKNPFQRGFQGSEGPDTSQAKLKIMTIEDDPKNAILIITWHIASFMHISRYPLCDPILNLSLISRLL